MPGATETVRPSSAVTSPGYPLVSAWVSMTAGPGRGRVAGHGGPDAHVCSRCQGARPAGRPDIGRQGETPLVLRGPRPGARLPRGLACRMTPAPAMTVTVSPCAPFRRLRRLARTSPRPPSPGPGPGRAPRPPLTKRLRPRHWAALDYVVGGSFGLILLATRQARRGPGHREPVRLRALPSARADLAAGRVPDRHGGGGGRHAPPPPGVHARRAAGRLGRGDLRCRPEVSTLAYFLPLAYVLYLVAATYEHRQAAVRVLIAVFAPC